MADGTYQVLNVVSGNAGEDEASRSKRIQIKNRRKRYLDTHPEYFGASLELAGMPYASLASSNRRLISPSRSTTV